MSAHVYHFQLQCGDTDVSLEPAELLAKVSHNTPSDIIGHQPPLFPQSVQETTRTVCCLSSLVWEHRVCDITDVNCSPADSSLVVLLRLYHKRKKRSLYGPNGRPTPFYGNCWRSYWAMNPRPIRQRLFYQVIDLSTPTKGHALG